jgi:general secretion pathway protein D
MNRKNCNPKSIQSMSLIYQLTRKSLLALLFLATPIWLTAQAGEAAGGDAAEADMVDRIVFRDESTDQVLNLLERLTGRSIIRPQALPAATFTFNSQRPMTRDEAILALQSLLTINGIGVSPMGELFLKVVPLARVRSEAPEFLNESTLNLSASGRIVSRMLQLEFLSIEEVQAQLNLMITSGSGSIIPFPKANAMMVTDTVSNLQSIEALLAQVDRPSAPRIETHFYPVRYARATDLVSQIQAFSNVSGSPELSGRTVVTADERSNQIILIADRRQVAYFENLIQKLDVQAELITRNEVIFLKHAQATEVASLLSQLATGRSGGTAGRAGTTPRTGQQTGQRPTTNPTQRPATNTTQRPATNTNQRNLQVPQIPGQTRAQSADVMALQEEGSGGGLSIGVAEGALNDLAGGVAGSDFSESLTILPDERSNAIVVSGTRQDIELISELIEKIDIILAQVRIEVFIAEISLSKDDARGIDSLGIRFNEGTDVFNFNVAGPGYSISRTDLQWAALFEAAKTRSEVEILSTPTLVTTHNKEARFLVGETRPVITGFSDGSFQGGTTRSQVQQQDIAIELIVKPLIGNDGTIQLEIFQKVDDLGEETVPIDGNPQPVIIRREAESFVSVSDGEIVILGGLQRARKGQSNKRMAILGDIPVLGNIFTSSSQTSVRQELLVFIRPTVLPTTRAANEDAQQQISRQSREPYIRHKMDPDVYPDPDEEPEEPKLQAPQRSPRRGARR